MNDIIRYFYEECIRKFVDPRTNLYEDPENPGCLSGSPPGKLENPPFSRKDS